MIEIILSIIILISIAIIVFMLFYIRWLLRTISDVDNVITHLWKNITDFNDHLNNIHSTEMFYGDSTLQALIEHSKQISESIESIKEFFLQVIKRYLNPSPAGIVGVAAGALEILGVLWDFGDGWADAGALLTHPFVV